MTELFVKFMLAVTTPRDEEKGATAVEYGLLVALIAAVIIGTVLALGPKIDAAFGSVNSQI
jgi:pilus assembly protein Flp/PilA